MKATPRAWVYTILEVVKVNAWVPRCAFVI